MKRNRLGNSSLLVSELALGTMTFGEQNSEVESHELIDVAVDRGINLLDAAEVYPVPPRRETQGRSEAIIGTWLAKGSRDRAIVATKIAASGRGIEWLRGGPKAIDRGNLAEAVDGSLRRLRTDYIDIYQIHWPDRYVPLFGAPAYLPDQERAGRPIVEQLSAFAELIKTGKIRHIGLSNETPWGIAAFGHAARAAGLPAPVSVQNAYSLLNRVFDLYPAEAARHEGLGLLAYSPLAFGHLTGKYLAGTPATSRLGLFPTFGARYDKPNVREAVAAYVGLARHLGLTPSALALAFVKSRWFVSSTIFGATTRAQLEENLASADVTLSAETLAAIDEIHHRYPSPAP